MTTYSFKDTSGQFTHPDVGGFPFSGQIGMGEFVVMYATERTAHDTASDGSIMVSGIAGNSGSLHIQVQQTSSLHAFLLNWANTVLSNQDNGNLTNFAAASVTLRSIVDGSTHVLNGVSPSKIPDKTYASQGGKITWILMAADVKSVTVGV